MHFAFALGSSNHDRARDSNLNFEEAEGMTAQSPKRRRIPRLWRVYRHREVLRLLISRDLKVRYSGTAMGYLWTIVEPLMLSLIFWFVFGVIFNGRDVGADPYILYLLSGML